MLTLPNLDLNFTYPPNSNLLSYKTYAMRHLFLPDCQ